MTLPDGTLRRAVETVNLYFPRCAGQGPEKTEKHGVSNGHDFAMDNSGFHCRVVFVS